MLSRVDRFVNDFFESIYTYVRNLVRSTSGVPPTPDGWVNLDREVGQNMRDLFDEYTQTKEGAVGPNGILNWTDITSEIRDGFDTYLTYAEKDKSQMTLEEAEAANEEAINAAKNSLHLMANYFEWFWW